MFRLGLIGYPLGHSFSAQYFNNFFDKENIDGVYSLYPLTTIDKLKELIDNTECLVGLNVTIPYKQSVIGKLDYLSSEAKEIGAVNVIAIERKSGKVYLTGHNTDWSGFAESIRTILNNNVKAALVLGTGGASKAVRFALKRLGIKTTCVSRDPQSFDTYLNETCIGYDCLDESIIKEHLFIVNTTPLGMYPDIDSYPPIPYEYIGKNHICYDLVYNPEKTMFLKLSEKMGATTKNGLEMLRLQADNSWSIWENLTKN